MRRQKRHATLWNASVRVLTLALAVVLLGWPLLWRLRCVLALAELLLRPPLLRRPLWLACVGRVLILLMLWRLRLPLSLLPALVLAVLPATASSVRNSSPHLPKRAVRPIARGPNHCSRGSALKLRGSQLCA